MMIFQISAKIEASSEALREESVKAGLKVLVNQKFISIQPSISNYGGTANMLQLTSLDFFNKVAKDYLANRNNGDDPVAALSKAIDSFKKNNDPDGLYFIKLELDSNRVVKLNPFLVWKSSEERTITLEKAVNKLG